MNSIGVNGEVSSSVAPTRSRPGDSVAAAGRRSRGCRSGRGSAGTPRTGARDAVPVDRPAVPRRGTLDQVPAWKNAAGQHVVQASSEPKSP
jgi:hypothetical protein